MTFGFQLITIELIVQGSFWLHLQRPGHHWLLGIHIQVCHHKQHYLSTIPRVITGAQTLEWWRISWCASKPPSRRPTRRRGESLLCMIVWSNARTAPWSVGKPWDFLFVCFSKVWFNSLCSDLEGLVPAKAQSLLLKKIEGLEQVMNKKINWNKLTSGGAGEYTCQDARSRNTRHWRAKSGSSGIRQWFFSSTDLLLPFDHMFLDRSSWCCSKCPVRWEQQF